MVTITTATLPGVVSARFISVLVDSLLVFGLFRELLNITVYNVE